MTVMALVNGDWEEAKKQGEISVNAFKEAGNLKMAALQLTVNSEIYTSIIEIDKAINLLKKPQI